MRAAIRSALAAVVVAGLPSRAAAQAPGEQAYGPFQRPPPAAAAAARDIVEVPVVDPRYLHDGLYFHYAMGGGLGGDAFEAPGDYFIVDEDDAGVFEGSVWGSTAGTQLALGGAPAPGWIIAVQVDTLSVLRDTTTGVNVGGDQYVIRVSQLAVYGAGLVVYPWPRSGFHLGAAGGFANFIAGQGDSLWVGPRARAHVANGGGYSATLGYEWWVGEQWGVGLSARWMQAWTSGTDPVPVEWSHSTKGITAMLGCTYQ